MSTPPPRSRGGAHPPVGAELGSGALVRDRFEGGAKLRQGEEQQAELLLDGGPQQVALGAGGEQPFALLRREPARGARGTGAGEGSDLFA